MKTRFIFSILILLPMTISSSADQGPLWSTPEGELHYWRTQLALAQDQLRTKKSQVETELKRSRTYYDLPAICQGRLTLASNTPITTTDQIGVATLFFTPYLGDAISIYSGTVWNAMTFTQMSLSLAGIVNGKNYDVFVFNNAGTPSLVLSAAWSSNTSRTPATNLTTQDGVYVGTSATGLTYVGTIRASAAGTSEDSRANRFVWNFCNRQPRFMWVTDAANSWNYKSATWRAANANNADRANFVIGMADVEVMARVQNGAGAGAGNGTAAANGIGLDSTTVNSAFIYGGYVPIAATYAFTTLESDWFGYPGIGFHFVQWLEASNAAQTITFLTTDGNAFQGGGMFVELDG
jgi:hypothetical protein